MDLSPPAMMRRARSDLGQKALRYSAVSIVGVAITQVVLVICHHDAGFGWSATTSNIVAVAIATLPSYVLNRSWVWGKRGRNHLTREVLPFWAFAFAGLLLSTGLVALVSQWSERPSAIMAANIVGFAILWVLKFFVLDQLMFGPHHHATDAMSLVDEDELEPVAEADSLGEATSA